MRAHAYTHIQAKTHAHTYTRTCTCTHSNHHHHHQNHSSNTCTHAVLGLEAAQQSGRRTVQRAGAGVDSSEEEDEGDFQCCGDSDGMNGYMSGLEEHQARAREREQPGRAAGKGRGYGRRLGGPGCVNRDKSSLEEHQARARM
eukprot:scaffold171480_cov21-Tisochrysis_lutea.AAC.1